KENLTIGYAIKDEAVKMENCYGEERKVTVQGFVFLKDVRELRSGRSLLILNLTNYTDSLVINMFSKNDDAASQFESSKEKIWIKARDKIQTDQFSGELVMMANDVQEINVARPADEATEKRVELHAHTTMSQLDAVVSPTRLI